MTGKNVKQSNSMINMPCLPTVSGAKTYKENESYGWIRFLRNHDPNLIIPVHRFHRAPLHDVFEQFASGLQLEVPNRGYEEMSSIGVFWVAELIRVAGYRALLRYDGYEKEQTGDFWVNLLSSDVHPVGWCAEHGKPLVPPQPIEGRQPDWKQYLVARLTGGRTLPLRWHDRLTKAFADCNRLPVGVILEMIDRDNSSRVVPAVVAESIGDRVRVKLCDVYKGKADNQDEEPTINPDLLWYNTTSILLFPVGWAHRVGYKLHCNDGYLKVCKKIVSEDPDGTNSGASAYGTHFARPDMFEYSLLPEPQMMQSTSDENTSPAKEKQNTTVKSEWREGMKFECLDPIEHNGIHVATVRKVLPGGEWLQVLFDGATDEEEDVNTFPVHCRSPYIFPVGFCETHGIELNKPGDMKTKFSWEIYLRQTNSVAAPANLFEKPLAHDTNPHGFMIGGKLESVDCASPHIMCPATVVDVKAGRLLRVSFDGWDSSFDQWQDYRSPYLKPAGWCEAVGHKLEFPNNYDIDADLPAPTPAKKSKH